jgi:hypothetical protein
MSPTESASGLGGLWVGISGAVPTPEEREAQQCSELDILMTVRRLAERIFTLGGRIVYGSHPTFTPIIESVALGMFPTPQTERVMMLVAPRYLFLPDALLTWDDFRTRHERYAVIEPIGTRTTAEDPALKKLRETLAEQADALVCIGGRPPRNNRIAGIEQEANFVRNAGKPLYLLGWAGGHARKLFEEQRASYLPALEKNQLNKAENEKLGRDCSIGESVRLVIEGLSRLAANR